MSYERKNLHLKEIVQTSMLIALALVVRGFSYMVYFDGAAGMRIGFSGVFTRLTAILFGPFWGGAASGIVDIIGFMFKPEGAYIPLLTVTAIFGGILSGILWKIVQNIDAVILQRVFLVLITVSGVFGIVNHIHILFFSDSFWARTISKLGKYQELAFIGLEMIAVIGMIFFLMVITVKKIRKRSEIYSNFLKLLIVTGFSGVFVTTLNTYILQWLILELGRVGFIAFWISRVVQEVFMSVVQSYIISLLLPIYHRFITK